MSESPVPEKPLIKRLAEVHMKLLAKIGDSHPFFQPPDMESMSRAVLDGMTQLDKLSRENADLKADRDRWHSVAMRAGAVTCEGGQILYLIDDLKARLAAAEEERDRARELQDQAESQFVDEEQRRLTAEAQVAKMRPALEPFAKLADQIEARRPIREHEAVGIGALPFQYLRAARDAISDNKTQEPSQ